MKAIMFGGALFLLIGIIVAANAAIIGYRSGWDDANKAAYWREEKNAEALSKMGLCEYGRLIVRRKECAAGKEPQR